MSEIQVPFLNQEAKLKSKALATLTVGSHTYQYYDLRILEELGFGSLAKLPYGLKVILENLLRHLDGKIITARHLKAVFDSVNDFGNTEIEFQPARVLMQDFTGVPAVVDLAAMRDAAHKAGKDPKKVNPLIPVDLVIDHSVMVDSYGDKKAFEKNVKLEFERNLERYRFLKWGQKVFKNFRVVPPGTGICHQVNLEYLAPVIFKNEDGFIYPDTVVGTDSHTTMINGLGVLGWGVGGIEAEAAMLGQPISMLIPQVVGFKLDGRLPEGVTATDLVLTVTNILRTKGVVGKFVEFYGPGLAHLSLADRATIANMAPEYGATCGLFPIDQETINYLKFTGRSQEQCNLVQTYAQKQTLWGGTSDDAFQDIVTLDLASIRPSLAGPSRPQDKVFLDEADQSFEGYLDKQKLSKPIKNKEIYESNRPLQSGDVVIAAITSCTNTSNPAVLVAAGLLARKANALGLQAKPWVKTSLAPGSQVVTDYLDAADLSKELDQLGFNLVGYGCTTCIGNSGPLPTHISKEVDEKKLVVCSVLSGNRNFEGRINPHVKASYLASPPLVVAYALAGSLLINFKTDPIGYGKDGKPVFLKDIWPSTQEINQVISQCIDAHMFEKRYQNVFEGPEEWKKISSPDNLIYEWDEKSTYICKPPYFEDKDLARGEFSIQNARLLALLGDSITTDHISPAGNIKAESPAGKYLVSRGVEPQEFNSYGARRGHNEVMTRGTFANIRLQNEMIPSKQGGFTLLFNNGTSSETTLFEGAMSYKQTGTPLVIIAGREYGSGSSRDWAAKGTRLLGVKAVIAESFERIHRSNLVGMGILPCEFEPGTTRKSLGLTGSEKISIVIDEKTFVPGQTIYADIVFNDNKTQRIPLKCRIDTSNELKYFQSGSILSFILNSF